LISLLESECGLAPGARVADVGSGTGILSQRLLEHGAEVYGIEPNREMRETGERLLAGYGNFTSVAGTAEATTLPDSSVGLVTAGQAFHWFDGTEARGEFARILVPDGRVALVWNSPLYDASPFMRDYRRLLQRFGTDWEKVSRLEVDARSLGPFFGGGFEERRLENRQTFGRESLRGRLLSSSFVPGPEDEESHPMLEELDRVFYGHQRGGEVTFEYEVRVFYGSLEG
jgi:SAM-dependent methyltransferase